MEDIRLPEDVLTSVMSRAATGPRAACIAATVSPAFRSAADSDTVWSRFLPADLAPLVYPSSSPPPRSKKELFLRLSGNHVLLEDGLTSAWLHRETGAKCYMVAARAMHIVWGHAPQYWRWIPRQDSRLPMRELLSKSRGISGIPALPAVGEQFVVIKSASVIKISKSIWFKEKFRLVINQSVGSCRVELIPEVWSCLSAVCYQRFPECAELLAVCWLDFSGAIESRMLSENTRYAAYLVFKMDEDCYGLDSPLQVASIHIGEDEISSHRVRLQNNIGNQQNDGAEEEATPRLPMERPDGWMELEIGEWDNHGGEDKHVCARVRETTYGGNWKKGLILQGVEIRPKN